MTTAPAADRAAHELINLRPPAFGLRDNLRLLADVVETVAPRLGRNPAS